MGSDDNSADLPNNLLFGQYELGRVLGQGSFAKVHLARDVRTNSTLAIKVINKDLVRRHPGLAAQITNEIAAMHLLRHPHVVSIHEVMATKTRIFVVMDYVRGGELFARVAAGRLPEPVARRYFQQLISAVDYCHSRGVSHRDLKPENLLLDEEGNLKISDFGLSALPEQRRGDGLLHTQCGTPAYVAPEVLRRKGYDGAKADLWSCGVILFVLLAGHLPFANENLMQMYCKVFKAEYATPPWFSADARRLISRLLVVDPQRRISIAALTQLPWFKKGLTIPTPPPLPPVAASTEEEKVSSPRSYNAFELISTMSAGFDLSGLFEGKRRGREVFTARRPAAAVMAALERMGRALGFGVESGKGYEVRMEGMAEGRKGRLTVMAEVFEVAEEVAVVEFYKASGDTMEYVKFCEDDVRPALKDIVWAWQGETPSNSGDCGGNEI